MTVATTSGGKWDPTSANLTFLAGNMEDHRIAGNDCTLIAVNEIRDKHYPVLDQWCDDRRILLDSGIFALTMTHGRNHGMHFFEALTLAPEEVEGFQELFDRYCDIATRFSDRLWGAIELDQGGRVNKPRMRARIVKETGIVPIPVYHPLGDGWAYYDEIAAGHDRICFANLSKASAPVRLRLMFTAAERARQYPHLWTHLLGLTPSPAMLSMPMRGSCDSSAWLSAVRWSDSWKSWAMLDRITTFPTGMTYLRGSDSDGDTGHRRAKALIAAQARFQQETVVAVTTDTHTTTGQGATRP